MPYTSFKEYKMNGIYNDIKFFKTLTEKVNDGSRPLNAIMGVYIRISNLLEKNPNPILQNEFNKVLDMIVDPECEKLNKELINLWNNLKKQFPNTEEAYKIMLKSGCDYSYIYEKAENIGKKVKLLNKNIPQHNSLIIKYEKFLNEVFRPICGPMILSGALEYTRKHAQEIIEKLNK